VYREHGAVKSDLEIAREARMRPIGEIAAAMGLTAGDIVPYGRFCAKVPYDLPALDEKPAAGRLVLVTAMTPTPMGEGKTTTTIGLGQALCRIGKKAVVAIREPSMGPCMGLKGGAAGGGYSQVLPMEDVNLHFTGDIHAVTAAHNLLSAVIDNHLHQKNAPELNPRQVVWNRVIDMNDRSLRRIVVGLEGGGVNGVMREDGFEITAASEVMAALCLCADRRDLKRRLGKIIVGYDPLRKPVTAADLGAQGAMTALLKHAINPNLVQSVEGTPVLVHGGPFANIAHGCNTLIATRMALRLAEYTVTEAGFGADLGAEKFFDIKCRCGGLAPSAAVCVVTRRAWKLHGTANIRRHMDNLGRFGVPAVVAVNRFADDPPEELARMVEECRGCGIETVITDFREAGGEGGTALAERICELCERESSFSFLYDLELPLTEKIRTIARTIYGAKDIEVGSEARKKIRQIEDFGYGGLPVCMAKTPASFTDDPRAAGCPEDFTITVTSAKVSAGAGFVVVYCGSVMTMPGLPKVPAALGIDIDERGDIEGLF
jgi:formate--tetrahydrofolate ligase